MTMPKAYKPEYGHQYQILCRHPKYDGRVWKHCDYAVDAKDKKSLLLEYLHIYGPGFEFKVIQSPKKYWKDVFMFTARDAK